MRVFVYFNLHKKVWSIKALQGPNKGRVIAHANRVTLSGCTFKVSEAGRQRVITEQRKNVHAGVVGHWDGHCDADMPTYPVETPVSVTYNPYKAGHFVNRMTGAAVMNADLAHLAAKSVTAWANA